MLESLGKLTRKRSFLNPHGARLRKTRARSANSFEKGIPWRHRTLEIYKFQSDFLKFQLDRTHLQMLLTQSERNGR